VAAAARTISTAVISPQEGALLHEALLEHHESAAAHSAAAPAAGPRFAVLRELVQREEAEAEALDDEEAAEDGEAAAVDVPGWVKVLLSLL
jgi:hypothetical protein